MANQLRAATIENTSGGNLIAQQEITAWRLHAPWSNDLMVEQDYLISKAVAAIFRDRYLSSQVAMRGGTVLHKGHLGPAIRYSEDIDLVLTGTAQPGHIKKAIHRVLLPLLGKPAESMLVSVNLAIRNFVSSSKILREQYVYEPTSGEAAHATLKVEVNLNENQRVFPLVLIPILVPHESGIPEYVDVVSYDLNEMLGTKLRALLQREHGRDLFDMWYASNFTRQPGSPLNLDPVRVAQAFHFYMTQEGSSFTQAQIQTALARRMASPKFRNDMAGYLAQNGTYSIEDAHSDFCTVYLPHL